jgi:hypothetical protein
MDGIRRFSRRRVQVAGATLAAAGLLLHLTGVVVGSLWWLSLLVLYAAGAAIGVWSESLKDDHVRHVVEDGLDADAIRAALAQQFRAVNGRIPAPAMERFLRIRKNLLELLPRVHEFSPGSMELFTLQQTALDYLPNALDTYLRLPPAYAGSSRVDGARTPVQVLLDELTLIDHKMEQVRSEVRRQDTDRLLAHDRFLEDRFGGERAGLPLPPGSEGAAEP